MSEERASKARKPSPRRVRFQRSPSRKKSKSERWKRKKPKAPKIKKTKFDGREPELEEYIYMIRPHQSKP